MALSLPRSPKIDGHHLHHPLLHTQLLTLLHTEYCVVHSTHCSVVLSGMELTHSTSHSTKVYTVHCKQHTNMIHSASVINSVVLCCVVLSSVILWCVLLLCVLLCSVVLCSVAKGRSLSLPGLG